MQRRGRVFTLDSVHRIELKGSLAGLTGVGIPLCGQTTLFVPATVWGLILALGLGGFRCTVAFVFQTVQKAEELSPVVL